MTLVSQRTSKSMIQAAVAHFFHVQEYSCAKRYSIIKKPFPFAWGLEHLDGVSTEGVEPCQALCQFSSEQVAHSKAFFTPASSPHFDFDGENLSYPSSVATDVSNNNRVHGRMFENNDRSRIVVLVPYWNATCQEFDRIGSTLKWFGFPSLRLSLPYHDMRMAPGSNSAELMVSPNIGRTIQSFRQAVLDVRLGIDFLKARGYQKVAIVGTSLGSCIGHLVAAHDSRVDAAVLALTGSQVSDVVWTGVATAHIKKALENKIAVEDLRAIWSVVSPLSYVQRFRDRGIQLLFLCADYDGVVLPELGQELVKEHQRVHDRVTVKHFTCGHYSFGMFPFYFFALNNVIQFLKRHLDG